MSWWHNLFFALGLAGRPGRALGATLVAAAVGISGAAIYSQTNGGGAAQSDHCFADPGACGFPDPDHNTAGVPSGTSLTNAGNTTVSTNGATLNAMNISGTLTVDGDNVTISNTRVTCLDPCGGNLPVTLNGSNTTITHSEINGSGGSSGVAVYEPGTSSASIDHSYIRNCGECLDYIYALSDSYVEVCYCEIGDSHYEDYYSGYGGGHHHLAVSHSVLLNPHIQTATLFMSNDVEGGPCSNYLHVDNSLLAGGGFLMYTCAHTTSAGTSSVSFTNNRFAKCTGTPTVDGNGWTVCTGHDVVPGTSYVSLAGSDGNGYYPYGGQFGFTSETYCASTTWTNNVWDHDSSAVACS